MTKPSSKAKIKAVRGTEADDDALAQYRRDKAEHERASQAHAVEAEPLPIATHKRCLPVRR